MASTPSRDFSLRLLEHEEQRHTSIFLEPDVARRSTLPRGWRAEDFLAQPGTRGFLPLEQAAERMGATESDVVELVERGHLLAEVRGGAIYVQPAIVTVTAVRAPC